MLSSPKGTFAFFFFFPTSCPQSPFIHGFMQNENVQGLLPCTHSADQLNCLLKLICKHYK